MSPKRVSAIGRAALASSAPKGAHTRYIAMRATADSYFGDGRSTSFNLVASSVPVVESTVRQRRRCVVNVCGVWSIARGYRAHCKGGGWGIVRGVGTPREGLWRESDGWPKKTENAFKSSIAGLGKRLTKVPGLATALDGPVGGGDKPCKCY
jgi:hypothetical protein